MHNQKYKISVIIVLFNNDDVIGSCLRSLYEQTTCDFETILIDNSSSAICQNLSNLFPNVLYIDSGANLGFAKACNLGARSANGEFLVFLNPDALLHNDAIGILLDFYQNQKNLLSIGICGPAILSNHESPGLTYGNIPTLKQLVTEQLLLHKLMPKSTWNKISSGIVSVPDRPIEVGYVSGACMLIESKTFHQIEGFDEMFFVYFEETDLALRLKKKNLRSYVVPDAQVIHEWGHSTKSVPLKRFSLYSESLLLFYHKWGKNISISSFILIIGRLLRFCLTLELNYLRQIKIVCKNYIKVQEMAGRRS